MRTSQVFFVFTKNAAGAVVSPLDVGISAGNKAHRENLLIFLLRYGDLFCRREPLLVMYQFRYKITPVRSVTLCLWRPGTHGRVDPLNCKNKSKACLSHHSLRCPAIHERAFDLPYSPFGGLGVIP